MYYEILGLKEECTLEEVEKAYKKLAKEKHPDKGGSHDAFVELSIAYDWILKNHNNKPEKRYHIRNGKKIEIKQVTKKFEWNLFDVFNGIDTTVNIRIGSKIIKAYMVESPRCITFFEKLKFVKTDDLDYIVKVVHTIITTSNSSFKLERKGYDLHLTVLVKTDALSIPTPLKGITIDNTKFDIVKFDALGLYEHLEDSTIFGDLYIDNSINKREIESEKTPIAIEENGFRMGGFLFLAAIAIWILQYVFN